MPVNWTILHSVKSLLSAGPSLHSEVGVLTNTSGQGTIFYLWLSKVSYDLHITNYFESLHRVQQWCWHVPDVKFPNDWTADKTWWCHQMETFSTLLVICAGNSLHKGQWRRALMFSLICAWINGCVNNREAGDLRCHRTHYDVTVMGQIIGTEDLQWRWISQKVPYNSNVYHYKIWMMNW